MDGLRELVADLRRAEVEDAKRLSIGQRFLLGAELFDSACEVTKAGIRWQNPHFTEEQVLQELRRRLDIVARREARA